MPDPFPGSVYKITTAELWRLSEQHGRLMPLPVDEADGFMHFSTAEQLRETLKRHFAGRSGLALLRVKLDRGDPGWKWEPSRGGELFPHFYGQAPISAVEEWAEIAVAPDGSADLPWGL